MLSKDIQLKLVVFLYNVLGPHEFSLRVENWKSYQEMCKSERKNYY